MLNPKITAIPDPQPDFQSLIATSLAMKEAVETLAGMKRDGLGRSAKYTELQDALGVALTTAANNLAEAIAALAATIPTTEQIQDIAGAMVSGGTETGISVTYDDTNARFDFVLDSEWLQDLVGAMVSGNTETNIAVTYDDALGKLNFVVATEDIQDIAGAMVSGGTETGISVTYDDTNGRFDFVLDSEWLQDLVGAMVTGNVESNLTVTYDDTNGKLDFALNNTISVTGNITTTGGFLVVDRVGDATAAAVLVQGDAGVLRGYYMYTGAALRWVMAASATAEGGANAGSNFEIYRYTDAGAFLATTLSISRATGLMTVAAGIDAGTSMEADAYTVAGTALSEYIADTAGAMVSGNTVTSGLTITYQDSDNTIDYVIDVPTLIAGAGIDNVWAALRVTHDSAVIADDQAASIMTIGAGRVGLMFTSHSTGGAVTIWGVDTIGTYELSVKVLGSSVISGGIGSASAGSGSDGVQTWYLSSGGVVSVSNRTNASNTFWAFFIDGAY